MLKTIIIAQDALPGYYLLKTQLETIFPKVQILHAQNGQELLDFLQSVKPCLIMMDLYMPKVDGFEATKVIRQHPEYAKIPIMGITATEKKETLQMAIEVGMNDIIGGAISLKILREKLQKLRLINSDINESKAPYSTFKHIDIEQMRENFSHNSDMIKQLLRMANELFDESLKKLKKAYKEEDYKTVELCLHKIKGSVMSINAEKMYAMLKEAEEQSKKDKIYYKNLYKSLKEEIKEIQAEIVEYIK